MRYFRLSHIPFKSRKIFIDTALTYIIGKSIILWLTLLFVSCIRCKDKMSYIIRSTIHILIFTHFIYLGLSLAMMVLLTVMIARVMIYMANFIYPYQVIINIPLINKDAEIMKLPIAGSWVFLVNALLTAIIAYMLIKAIRSKYREKRSHRKGNCPIHKRSVKEPSGEVSKKEVLGQEDGLKSECLALRGGGNR